VIIEAHIIDPYLHGSGKGLKQSIVDVRAKTRDGRQFLVEMQMLPVAASDGLNGGFSTGWGCALSASG
jgi:hypothetical protein